MNNVAVLWSAYHSVAFLVCQPLHSFIPTSARFLFLWRLYTYHLAVHAKVPCLMLADHYKPQNAKQIYAEGSIQTHEPYTVYQEGSLVQHLNKYMNITKIK